MHLPLYYKTENSKEFPDLSLKHFLPLSPVLETTDIFNIVMVLAFPKHYAI